MGFWSRLVRGGREVADADAIKGWAQVVSVSQYHEGLYSRCRMQLVVQADGIAPTAVAFEGLVRREKWPQPGMQLPVLIDRNDPTAVDVAWDLVPDSGDRAAASAEAIAASLRGEAGAVPPAALGGVQVVNLSGRTADDLSPDQLARLRALGIDPAVLGGSGATAPAAASSAGPGAGADPADDDIARLERLADLRDRGALTDAEFEAQKREVLDGD